MSFYTPGFEESILNCKDLKCFLCWEPCVFDRIFEYLIEYVPKIRKSYVIILNIDDECRFSEAQCTVRQVKDLAQVASE